MSKLTIKNCNNRHIKHPIQLNIHRKTLLLLLVIALFNSKAIAFSQGLNLAFKDSPLSNVFKEIERQSKFEFIYPSSELHSKRISISVVNAKIEEVMDKCLAGLPFTYYINANRIVVSKKSIQLQEIQNLFPDSLINVHGTVLNNENTAVAGATVSVKGSNTATSTFTDGTFSLIGVKRGAILLISSVGYEPKIVRVYGNSKISIQLTVSAQQMKEVVVMNNGFQKMPKERATGSFVLLDSSIINRSVDPNILSRLEGLAPGLLFDKRNPLTTSIQIRGVYSLNEEAAAPLVVVNNFPYAGNIRDLNPNDIESITILRDAAAASIWGAKSGNGVIVITTKNGQFNQPLTVSLNSSLKITGKPNLLDLPVLSTSDQIDLETDYFQKGWFDAILLDPTVSVPEVVSILDEQRKGNITPEDAKNKIDALRSLDVRKDYLKYLYRKDVQQQYSISISGGNSISKYYVSVGYDKSLESLITNDNYRITIQTGNTLKLSNAIQASFNVAYTNTFQNSFSQQIAYGSTQLGNRILPQYSRLVDEKGNPASIDAFYRGSFVDTLGQGALLDWKLRPLDEARLADNITKSNSLLASANIQAIISKGITAEINYQYQYNNSENQNNQSVESYFARDLINSFTNLYETSQSKRYPVPIGGILDAISTKLISHNLRGQLGISKALNSDFRIDAIAGAELRQIRNYGNVSRTYGYNNEYISYSDVDYVNQYPIYYFGYYNRIPSNIRIIETENRLVSLFLNSSFTFLSKYILSTSVRKDASNLFGVKSNDRGRPFYSVGALWRISNENFYNLSFLPTLNFRATIGTGGNILSNATATPIMIALPGEANSITGLPYAFISSPGNPSLKWEKVTTLNLGIDFGLKNNRISGSIEYYKKWSSDLYSSKPIDPSTGFIILQTNAANIQGAGIDIQLNSKNINGTNFKWYTTFNISRAQYKVTSFPIKYSEKGLLSDGTVIFPIEGINPYSIISYKWGGLDATNGDPQGFLDGKISKDYNLINQAEFKDLVVNGSALPLTFGNLLNTFTWKNVSLSTNITYRLDYFFRKQSVNYVSLASTGASHIDYLRRWQKPGDELSTDVPSMAWPLNMQRELFYNGAEVNVLNAGHVRWNDIQIVYNINQKQFPKIPISNISLYATISNLNIIIWKANSKGIDPEFQQGAPPKGLVLGAKINF